MGVIGWVLGAGLAVWLVTAGAVWMASLTVARDPMPMADVIIVLGGSLRPDGAIGGPSQRRLEPAISAIRAGRAETLIVSGGERLGPDDSDAHRMATYAVAANISSDRIRLEPDSRTTLENLVLSRRLLDANETRVVLATDAYHLPRAKALAWLIDLPVSGGLVPQNRIPSRLAIAREAIAWWVNLARGTLWLLADRAGLSEETRLRFLS